MNDNCKIIETLHFRVAPNVGTKKEKAAWRTNDSFFLTASFNRLLYFYGEKKAFLAWLSWFVSLFCTQFQIDSLSCCLISLLVDNFKPIRLRQ